MTAWQDALFAPRRVAVVGASATPGKAGYLFLNNLAKPEAGFDGKVIAIHPSATEVLGCPSYPSLVLAPGPVDLAIVVTPPAAVPGAIEDCGRARVAVAVVITGGFAETGPRGAQLQRDVVQAAAAGGVRIVGPNCFGVINTASGLNASLSIGLPAKGGVSLITQSGAYGMAAYSRSIDEGAGFAKIIALGNKADLDEVDLLEFLAKDPETKVVAMLLEFDFRWRQAFRDGGCDTKAHRRLEDRAQPQRPAGGRQPHGGAFQRRYRRPRRTASGGSVFGRRWPHATRRRRRPCKTAAASRSKNWRDHKLRRHWRRTNGSPRIKRPLCSNIVADGPGDHCDGSAASRFGGQSHRRDDGMVALRRYVRGVGRRFDAFG